MYKYTLAVTSPEYWNTIHNVLTVDSNEDGIPDRKVTCSDCKEHSPTRGTYLLTHEEATGISTHPHVKWIELSPTDHPDAYPDPEPATKRFRASVKVYRDLSANPPPASATSAEDRRTNWAVKRVGIATNGEGWPNINGNPSSITSDISYSLTGKNVDLVIQDSGILQYHPEFLDDDGKSRVRDVILDGPYYIDPSYFTSNSYTYTKPDGRIGITTASAHSWWENSSNRSGSFSSVGTVAIPDGYTVANTLGIGGTSHTMTSSHGSGCAGLSAGRNFGLAFESEIWNIGVIGSPTNLGVEASYDIIKIFHQNKPTNTSTGRQNPTLVNGSWGYFGGFDSGTSVSYKFKGSTGSFTGYSSSSTGVQALAYGLRSGTSYNRQYSTSSRSDSIDTAGKEMIDAGVIFVAAAGNNNQRLGIGANDAHRLDYLTTLNGADTRTGNWASGTCPSGHRDWIHPQGLGFDSTTDFHPAVCVGAMEEFIGTIGGSADYKEQQADYSNNGPGIDVWAPADETLSVGMRAANGDQLGTETNYARYNSNFVDRYFNGTSAAAPVVSGVIALFLESKPNATSAEVKDFIKTHASKVLPSTEWSDPYSDDTDADYWRQAYNNRGALNRIIFDPSATDIRPTFAGVMGGENIITSGLVLNLDGNNYTSGTTWTDTSGQSNNGTLTNGITYSSDNGGVLVLNGTSDYVITGSDMFNANSNFTFSIWFNSDSFAEQKAFAADVNNSQSLFLRYNSGIQVVNSNTAILGSFSSSTLSTNTWHNVTVTRSSNTYTLYVDGISKSILIFSHTYTRSPDTIGANHNVGGGGKNFFDGKISKVLAYSTALSDSDVKHNFDTMKGRYLNNPLILSGISYSLT